MTATHRPERVGREGGRERQARQQRRRRQGAVVRPVRHAARGVAEQAAWFRIVRLHFVGRPLASAEAPAVLVVAGVAARVDEGVGTLHMHGTAAVLVVVAALLAPEAVVDRAY